MDEKVSSTPNSNSFSGFNSPIDKNTSNDKSLIDSLFDSDSELSEFDDSHFYFTRKRISIESINDKLERKSRKKNKDGILVNPFKSPNMEDAEEDWITIKKYITNLPKKSLKSIGKSLICTNGKRSLRNADYLESDDNCAVCLGKGKVLCCDSCPRVFHVDCLDEVLDYDPLPEFWECNSCRKVFKCLFYDSRKKTNEIGKFPRIVILICFNFYLGNY